MFFTVKLDEWAVLLSQDAWKLLLIFNPLLIFLVQKLKFIWNILCLFPILESHLKAIKAPTEPVALHFGGLGSVGHVRCLLYHRCPCNFLERGFWWITQGDGGSFFQLRYCQGQCAFQDTVCEILSIESVKKIELDKSLSLLFLLNIDELSSGCTSNFQL